MLYAVWFRRSRTCIYVQLQTPIWMSVHALVIHLQLYYTKHYKNTPAAQHPRSQTNYTSMTRDFSVTRLSLKGITSKCDQAWSHLMGFGGTCRGLSGWDGVISKGRHSPSFFLNSKWEKVIAGDRHLPASMNTKQLCLMHDLSTSHQFLKIGVLYLWEDLAIHHH